MATECLFMEGGTEFLNPGIAGPVNTRFRLSDKPIAFDLSNPVFGDLYVASDYTTLGEIVGWTGLSAYSRITVPTPAPINKIITYTNIVWQVGAALDAPNNVRTLCLEDPATLKALFAYDLRQAVQTTTVGSHTMPVGTINVVDTTNFKTAGTFVVNGKSIAYTGKTATTYTGCTGPAGVIAAGSKVYIDALDLSGPNNASIGLSVINLFAQNPGGT